MNASSFLRALAPARKAGTSAHHTVSHVERTFSRVRAPAHHVRVRALARWFVSLGLCLRLAALFAFAHHLAALAVCLIELLPFLVPSKEMVLRVWMPKVSKAGYGQRAAPWHVPRLQAPPCEERPDIL